MDKSVPPGAAILLDFIGSIEAPKGYGTVYGNNQAKLPKPLTSMTFAEVVAAGPGWTRSFGSSACGRYQFMRNTLDAPKKGSDIKAEMGLTGSELFDADLQDRMALHLLRRRGYDKFVSGRIGVVAFALALAQEWASFPVLKAVQGAHRRVARGETYYAGDKLNKALVPPERIEAVLAQVLAAVGRSDNPVRQPAPVAQPVVEEVKPPEAKYVPAPVASPASLPWWRRLAGLPQPALEDARPGLAPNGDPALYDVQKKLKALGYEPMLLDGLNGRRTRDQVRAARERNAMAPSDKVDAEFKAALPGMLPAEVSEIRTEASDKEVAQRSPELFSPLKGLTGGGLITAATSALAGGADQGWFGKVNAAADQVSQTSASIQSALATVVAAFGWIAAHWWIIGIVAGLWLALRAYVGWLKLRALWRQGRAT